MDAATLAKLQDFVEAANHSGQLNYDWGCQIVSVVGEHVYVRFFDTDQCEDEEEYIGKLSVHSDTLMAWQEKEDTEPIIFSNHPWILVSITYAGP